MDRAIFKNTGWLLSAQSLVKVISFFYTIFLARSLGVNNFGLFIAALSYFSLIASVADFGITRYLVREVSKEEKKLSQLLSTTIFFRFSLLLIFSAVLMLGIYLFDPEIGRRNLSLLAILAVFPQSISLSLDAAFVALLKMRYSALGTLVLSTLTTLLGITLVSLGYGVQGAVVALILGQVLYTLTLVILISQQKIKWKIGADLTLLKSVLKGSLPYGILAMMGLIYFKVDTLLLSYLRGNFETGIYGAAYKFLEAIVFIPATLAVAVFPVLSKLHEVDNSNVKALSSRIIKIMFGLGIVVALGFIFILPEVIKILLPNYLTSIGVIRILSLAIPFMFIHVPLAQVVLSSDKYLKPVIFISLINLSFNIILNLIFIPQYGFWAAAWITVASDVLSFLTLYILIKKIFR